MSTAAALTVRTNVLDDPRPLLDLVPDVSNPAVWLTGDDGFVTWGTAARIRVGVRPCTATSPKSAFA
ncbi:MAG: hypothetical protein WD011_07585, partial [Nitriliruptoraceae bacterium]